MSNIEILNKLTTGKNAVETVTINYENEDYPFEIRPLTSGELSQLQAIEKKGFVMKVGVNPQGKRQSVTTNTDIDVNAGEFNEHQTEAMYTAIAWSLGKEVTVENVKSLPVGLPELIFTEVIRISTLTDNDLTIIKQFRKK